MIKIFILLPDGKKPAYVVLQASVERSLCTPTIASVFWLRTFSHSCMDSSSISPYRHPFTVSICCTCYLSQAGDPSSGFHLDLTYDLEPVVAHLPWFSPLHHVLPTCTLHSRIHASNHFQEHCLYLYFLQSLPFLHSSFTTFPLLHKLLTFCTNKLWWLQKIQFIFRTVFSIPTKPCSFYSSVFV